MKEDPSDDPKMKELLHLVDNVDFPDYPDYRRGIRWGIVSGIVAALIVLTCVVLGGALNDVGGRLLRHGWTSPVIGGCVFLVIGAFGAFRPPKF